MGCIGVGDLVRIGLLRLCVRALSMERSKPESLGPGHLETMEI